MRMATAFRAWIALVAAAWGKFLAAEDKRFSESIKIVEDSEEDTNDVDAPAPCKVDDSAPSLADIIRKRQPTAESQDFMYRPEGDSHDED